MPISAVSKTDPGLKRELNEDSVAVLDEYGLVILADGMGGYNAGEVASQLAVESITASLVPSIAAGESRQLSVANAITQANTAILDAVEADPEFEGMATTVVTGVFADDQVFFGHVGDSRIYRYREGRLERLTRDHSMIQALIDDGMFKSVEEALAAGVKSNVLLRGLGIEAEVEVDTGIDTLKQGDLYLFCSDGLSNMVTDQEMQTLLSEESDDLSSCADRLLALALEHGGTDNVSLALVRP